MRQRKRDRQTDRLTERKRESLTERIGSQDNEGWLGKSKIKTAAIKTDRLESQVEP